MATNTKNYNLVKPAENELADISVLNKNMDVIDEQILPVNGLNSVDLKKPLAAAQGKVLIEKIGDLSTLTTEHKENLVQAINDAADGAGITVVTESEYKSMQEAGTVDADKLYGIVDAFDSSAGNVGISDTLSAKLGITTDKNVEKAIDIVDMKVSQNTKAITEVNKSLSQANTIKIAGGTAIALTLDVGGLIDGHILTFKASSNNSGNATTINGIPLYKPNTTIAPTLIAGKAYTIWYKASVPCFFIKASAEGTAVAANVLAGTTFSNDNDVSIPGSMPNNGIVNVTLTKGGEQYIIPAGYHNGGGKVAVSTSIEGKLEILEVNASKILTIPQGVKMLYLCAMGGGSAGLGNTSDNHCSDQGGNGGGKKDLCIPCNTGDILNINIGLGGIASGKSSNGGWTTAEMGGDTIIALNGTEILRALGGRGGASGGNGTNGYSYERYGNGGDGTIMGSFISDIFGGAGGGCGGRGGAGGGGNGGPRDGSGNGLPGTKYGAGGGGGGENGGFGGNGYQGVCFVIYQRIIQ